MQFSFREFKVCLLPQFSFSCFRLVAGPFLGLLLLLLLLLVLLFGRRNLPQSFGGLLLKRQILCRIQRADEETLA